MRKKFLAAMMTVCMVLSLMTVPAFASVDPSTRDTKGYSGAELPKGPDTTTDIWTVTPENAQYTLDGAYGSINGKTIRFSAGTYGNVLVLGRASKFSGSETNYYSDNWITPADYENLQDNGVYRYSRTVENVTFTAEEGVVLPGFTASSGHMYGTDGNPSYDYVRETSTESTNNSHYASVTLKNLTFDGLTFSGGISINDYLENSLTDGITFTDCTFLGDEIQMATNGFCGISMKADAKNFSNVTVVGCTFTDYFQGIYVQGPVNWTIQNCMFDNTTHNAIALQSSTNNTVTGTISVKENIIKNAHDRAVRLGNAEDASVVLENNVMLSSGDSDGQLIKAGTLTGTTVSLNYNYWDRKTTAVDSSLPQPAVTGVRGGTFAETIQPAYCAAGFEPVLQADGSYAVKLDGSSIFAGGTGTAVDPYQIADATQLAAFRDNVNGGYSYAGECVKLTANVTLDDSNWTPIGNGQRKSSGYTGNAFQGTFDGGKCTISALSITSGSGDTAIGLFGVLDGGTVRDLKLADLSIQVSDNECAGGVAGLLVNDAVVTGCEVSGSISIKDGAGGIVGRMLISGTISDCINNADVTCTAGGAAGIVGKAYYTQPDKTMTIESCVNNGAITNGDYHAGGISAFSAANVTDCTNNGVITAGNTAGGIVAEQVNWGTVSGCTNTAVIKGNNNAGGIIGWIRYQTDTSAYAKSSKISVLNNTNSGMITTKTGNVLSGGLGWGGIVGTAYNAALVSGNENQADSITGGTFGAGIVGNLQENNGNLYYNDFDIHVGNNVSTTTLDSISVNGSCKDLYAYNNKSGTFVVGDNSTEWVAQIGEQKYTTLQYAIDSAEDGETITVLRNVELTTSLNLTGATNLTIQGATKDVTISTSGIAGQKVFSGALSGTFTLKDLTFTKAIVTITNATGAVTVDGCTFKDTATTQNDKSGVLNVSGSGTGASLAVTESTFQNLTRDTSAGGAEFVGIYASGTLQSISVQDSQFQNIAGTALSLRGSGTVTITGNTFENWAYGSNADEGRAVRVDFSGQAAPTFTFKENKLLPGTQTKESYVKVGEISDSAVPSLDVGRNYWNGQDPAVATVGDPPTPILEIEINGQALTAAELRDQVTGTTSYYKVESMREQDLSDYVPPVSGGGSSTPTYTSTVESTTNGTVTVSPKNASKGATVTITVTPDEGYVLDTITVTDKDGKTVEVTKTSDTKYTFQMPGSAVTVKATFAEKPDESKLPFTDVAESAWYYDAVVYVYENGMMTGTNDGTTFSPAMNLTRGMMAQVLYNIEQGTAGTADTFTDVAANAWYADAVNWAASKGIVNGYGDGTFGPEDSITREQMAVLLYNYAKYKGYDMTATTDLTAFSDDEQVSDWAEYAMQWAVAEKLIQGSNNALNPLGTASRAEVAQILMNFGTIVEK